MNGNLSFSKIDECVEILREVSQNNKSVYQNKSIDFYSSRFCSQDMFNIILSGGNKSNLIRRRIVLNRTQQVNGENYEVVKSVAPIL